MRLLGSARGAVQENPGITRFMIAANADVTLSELSHRVAPLIVGWIMGYRDVRAMREGSVDPANQVMSLIGMILSIVGVGISVCVAIFSCAAIGLLGLLCAGGAFAPPPPGPPPVPGPKRF